MREIDLARFFKASTVAIIGASESGTGASVYNNLKAMGFPKDNLYLVNPRRERVFDQTCYRSVSVLPISPDVAFIATRAQIAVSSIEECANRGIHAGIIFAEGFTESGEEGRLLQQRLVKIATDNDFLLCGPNCMGYVVPSNKLGLWAINLPANVRNGNIGAVFQSSGMLNLFFDLITKRGYGFSTATSVGNEAVLETSQYLDYLVSDPETKIIIMYLEGIKNAENLVKVLDKARSANKQILAIRAGRSELARQNLIAHTGKLVSSSSALDALLKQKGVILVSNYDELLETALLFSSLQMPEFELKQSIGIITNSGGDATYLSDLGERLHLPLAKLSPEIRNTISKKLEKPTLVGNPLDITDFHPGFNDSIDAFLSETSFDVACCRLILPYKPSPELIEEYRKVNSIAHSHGKTIVFLSRASECFDKDWYDFFTSINAPFLLEYEKGLKAVSSFLLASKRKKTGTKALEPTNSLPTLTLDKEIVQSPAGILPFEIVRDLATNYQISMPPSGLARDPKTAIKIATQVGYPVALKVVSRDFAHKTEAGIISLDNRNASEVEQNFSRIIESAKRHDPIASIEGVLVQRMIGDGVAEVLIGTSRDPQLGPVVVFGLGGIFVELLNDVVMRVPPFDLTEAYDMIEELKGKEILLGFRGKPKGDLDALAKTIWHVSRLALDFKENISEFEINPLLILPYGNGVSAVDIRVVKS